MTKFFKDITEACWVGYKKVGMKKKGDRMVPDCVKEELVNAVFGKDYIYREPVMEDAYDAYKGKLNKDQIATIKNTWKDKTASDVTQGVKDMVKKYDAFTRMDLKKANIKHISNLINDEVQQTEDLNKDDEKKVKDVVKGLDKAMSLHGKQAKSLKKALQTEQEELDFITPLLNETQFSTDQIER